MFHKCVCILLLLFSCKSSVKKNAVQVFLDTKNYKYSDKVDSIPNYIITLMKEKDSTLKITDVNSYDSLCLTDDCNEGLIYNAKLNFLLYSDSEWLISYTRGGVGIHGVLDYYKMEEPIINFKSNVMPPIEDTVSLFSKNLLIHFAPVGVRP